MEDHTAWRLLSIHFWCSPSVMALVAHFSPIHTFFRGGQCEISSERASALEAMGAVGLLQRAPRGYRGGICKNTRVLFVFPDSEFLSVSPPFYLSLSLNSLYSSSFVYTHSACAFLFSDRERESARGKCACSAFNNFVISDVISAADNFIRFEMLLSLYIQLYTLHAAPDLMF
jgi:hypothetical protein